MALNETRLRPCQTWAVPLLVVFGCATTESYDPNARGSGGSTMGTGGTSVTTGGTGGTTPGTGGGAVPATGGGRAETGGAPVTGGVTGTGSGGQSVAAVLTLPWMDDFETDAPIGQTPRWRPDPSDTTGKWMIVTDGSTKVLQEQVAVSSMSLIVGGDVAWADQKVETKVKFTTVTTSSIAYVVVRFVDFKNYYFLEFKGDGSMKIRKRITSSTSDLVTYKTKVPLVAGTWYAIGFGFQGNTVTAYLDGAAVGTMTETAASLPMGGIALGFQDGSGSFDDVKVTLP